MLSGRDLRVDPLSGVNPRAVSSLLGEQHVIQVRNNVVHLSDVGVEVSPTTTGRILITYNTFLWNARCGVRVLGDASDWPGGQGGRLLIGNNLFVGRDDRLNPGGDQGQFPSITPLARRAFPFGAVELDGLWPFNSDFRDSPDPQGLRHDLLVLRNLFVNHAAYLNPNGPPTYPNPLIAGWTNSSLPPVFALRNNGLEVYDYYLRAEHHHEGTAWANVVLYSPADWYVHQLPRVRFVPSAWAGVWPPPDRLVSFDYRVDSGYVGPQMCLTPPQVSVLQARSLPIAVPVEDYEGRTRSPDPGVGAGCAAPSWEKFPLGLLGVHPLEFADAGRWVDVVSPGYRGYVSPFPRPNNVGFLAAGLSGLVGPSPAFLDAALALSGGDESNLRSTFILELLNEAESANISLVIALPYVNGTAANDFPESSSDAGVFDAGVRVPFDEPNAGNSVPPRYGTYSPAWQSVWEQRLADYLTVIAAWEDANPGGKRVFAWLGHDEWTSSTSIDGTAWRGRMMAALHAGVQEHDPRRRRVMASQAFNATTMALGPMSMVVGFTSSQRASLNNPNPLIEVAVAARSTFYGVGPERLLDSGPPVGVAVWQDSYKVTDRPNVCIDPVTALRWGMPYSAIGQTGCNNTYSARWEVATEPLSGALRRTSDDQYHSSPTAAEVPDGDQDRRVSLLRARLDRESADNVLRLHENLLDKVPTKSRAWHAPRMMIPQNFGYADWADFINDYTTSKARYDLISGIMELDGIWIYKWGERDDNNGNPTPAWSAWRDIFEAIKVTPELREAIANGELLRREFGGTWTERWDVRVEATVEPAAVDLLFAGTPSLLQSTFWAGFNVADYFGQLKDIEAFNWTVWRLGQVQYIAVTYSGVWLRPQISGNLMITAAPGMNVELVAGPPSLTLSVGPQAALPIGGTVSISASGSPIELVFPPFEGVILRVVPP